MKKITIIDYECGNILNLVRAIKFLDYEVEITYDNKKIINSSHVILPGVGAFGNAMQQLEKYSLYNTILEYAKLNKPLLGICLGMQLAVIEIARNVLKLEKANSTEFVETDEPVVGLMTEWYNKD